MASPNGLPEISVEARTHLEDAAAIFDPERDRDLAFRFGQDVGVSAMVYSAIVLWPLGEVDRAREIADATAARIANLNHLATSTYGSMHCAMFEIIARKRRPRRALGQGAV